MTKRPTPSPDAWHRKMYDAAFARQTLNAAPFRKLAGTEVAALCAILGLKRGDQLLDVPCGTGRHSVEFARRGIDVTAVDINRDCLSLARKNRSDLAASAARHLRLEQGDMADLKKFQGRFDAVVNLFTSFGYFSTDQKNEAVLRELVSTLKPGGRIALHLVNRDWLLQIFSDGNWSLDGDQLTVCARRYDPESHYNNEHRIVLNQKTGRAQKYFHQLRLYSKTEMVALMKKAGLKKIRAYGNYQGEPFSKFTSSYPIYVGEQ